MTDEELQQNIDWALSIMSKTDALYKDAEAEHQRLLAEQRRRNVKQPKLIADWYYS